MKIRRLRLFLTALVALTVGSERYILTENGRFACVSHSIDHINGTRMKNQSNLYFEYGIVDYPTEIELYSKLSVDTNSKTFYLKLRSICLAPHRLSACQLYKASNDLHFIRTFDK